MIYALPDSPTAWDIVRRSTVAHPSLFADTLDREGFNLRTLAMRLEPTRATLDTPTGAMCGLATGLEMAADILREDGDEELRHLCELRDGYKAPNLALRRALVAIAGALQCLTRDTMEAALGEVR